MLQTQEKEAIIEAFVDPELIKSNLYNLGKTFNNARHAYLSLSLSFKDLTTVNVNILVA